MQVYAQELYAQVSVQAGAQHSRRRQEVSAQMYTHEVYTQVYVQAGAQHSRRRQEVSALLPEGIMVWQAGARLCHLDGATRQIATR